MVRLLSLLRFNLLLLMEKRILGVAAALLFSCTASAQVGYGLKAGVNLSKLSASMSEGNTSTDYLTSFHFTAYMDAPVATNLFVQPGLSLQGKGGKSQSVYDGAETEEYKTDLMYLEVPVNVVYYIPSGMGDVFVGAGPYAAYGLSGKEKNNSESFDVEWGGDDGIKRFDFGANLLGGYKFDNGVLVTGSYGLGLANLAPKNDVDDLKLRNRMFSLGVGYQF